MADLRSMNQNILEYLVRLPQQGLEDWLAIYLKHGVAAPSGLPVRDSLRAETFCDELWDSMDVHGDVTQALDRQRLRRRIRLAVAHLIRQWTPPSEPPSYFLELLVLAGSIAGGECCESLIDLAEQRSLEGIGAGYDLQREILRVLLGDPKSLPRRSLHRLEQLATTYLDHPAYSSVCFEYFWRKNKADGLRLLRRYVRSAERVPSLAFSAALLAFHTSTGPEFLAEHLPSIRDGLQKQRRFFRRPDSENLFERYLRGLGPLCTLTLDVPLARRHEPGLESILQWDAHERGLEKPGMRVAWHPPFRASESCSFRVDLEPSVADVAVLALIRGAARLRLERVLAEA